MNTITVQAAALAAALKHSVAPARSTLATIMHARLRVDGDQLRVETTDTEVWAQASVPVTGDADFDILLRDDLLRSAVGGAKGDLVIHADGKVRNGRSRYAIPSLPGADFPTADDADWKPVAIDAAPLAAALRAVSYSGDADSPNHTFRAVNVTPGLVWATDAKQAAAVALSYDGPRIAVPVAQVLRVAAALDMPGARIEVAGGMADSAGLLRIVADDMQVSLRLLPAAGTDIAGAVRSIDTGPACADLRREPLIAALRRFMPFVAFNLGKKLPTASLALEDGVLTLRDRKAEFLEELQGVMEGEPTGAWRLTFDPKRLLLALHAITTDTVRLFPSASGIGVRSGLICLAPAGLELTDVAHLLAPITE
jgi:hypothetical protein